MLLPTDILNNHSQQTDRKELMNARKQKTRISDSWKRVRNAKERKNNTNLYFLKKFQLPMSKQKPKLPKLTLKFWNILFIIDTC